MKIAALLFLVLLAGCGRFQAVPAVGATAYESRVWRLDTITGAVSLCYETAATIRCLQPSQ